MGTVGEAVSAWWVLVCLWVPAGSDRHEEGRPSEWLERDGGARVGGEGLVLRTFSIVVHSKIRHPCNKL